MKTKPLPIGVEDFATLIEDGYYFVDKTLFIKDLLDRKGNRSLFHGLAIEKAGESYFSHFGRYPVINLTLKSAKQPDWELAFDCMLDEIVMEYERHRKTVENSDSLSEEMKRKYLSVLRKTASRSDYAKAIQFLSICLEKAHGEKVVILIDEYDVPLENAFFNGFYNQMSGFIRSLFESALKTNEALAFAVMTGCLFSKNPEGVLMEKRTAGSAAIRRRSRCLRISKESIFTGLNNLKINSIRQNREIHL